MEVRIRKNGEKEALWKTRIEACAQSGLSEKAFCKREGIALSTFRYWKANVRKKQCGFVELVEKETPLLPSAPLVLVLDGIGTLEIPPQYSAAHLAVVVRALLEVR